MSDKDIMIAGITFCDECSLQAQGAGEGCRCIEDLTGDTAEVVIAGRKGCGRVYSKDK